MTEMTEMLYGSRFLDGVDLPETADLPGGSRYVDGVDEFDDAIEYTPRHLRAVQLSPELQEALDAAFAPETPALPVPESMPLPEPAPVPTRLLEADDELAVDSAPAGMVVPETIEYPAVLRMPEAAEPVSAATVLREEADVAPEPVAALPEVPVIIPRVPATAAPVHTPVSPTPFPEQEIRAARARKDAKPRASLLGRRLRPQKVDVSRLMVPSPAAVNG